MTPFRNALACLLLSFAAATASAEGNALQGHQLRLSPVDKPDATWITQDDVATAERVDSVSNGHPVLRVHLKPDSAQRMKGYTSANIGKKVRFTWDGTVIHDLTIASGFGTPFELPAPPK
jgi:preprotein translocase subunit SecD